jgi:hypothetical protein
MHGRRHAQLSQVPRAAPVYIRKNHMMCQRTIDMLHFAKFGSAQCQCHLILEQNYIFSGGFL